MGSTICSLLFSTYLVWLGKPVPTMPVVSNVAISEVVPVSVSRLTRLVILPVPVNLTASPVAVAGA